MFELRLQIYEFTFPYVVVVVVGCQHHALPPPSMTAMPVPEPYRLRGVLKHCRRRSDRYQMFTDKIAMNLRALNRKQCEAWIQGEVLFKANVPVVFVCVYAASSVM